MHSRVSLTVLLALATSCGDGARSNPVKDALAATRPPGESQTSVAFRLPGSGRNTGLYRLPALAEVAWRFEAARAAPAAVVGFVSDEDLVYALTQRQELVALDLGSGLVRTVDSAVARAVMSPTGSVHIVRTDSSVAQVSRRIVTEWDARFSGIPAAMHGAVRDRLVGIVDTGGSPRLELLSPGQASGTTQPLPRGEVAFAPWGDAVAVATETGVAILDPTGDAAPRHFDTSTPVRHVTFSPSGHRLYVADGEARLTVVERFELDVLGTLQLPEPPAALRPDPHGRLLLAAGSEETVYVIDLVPLSVVGRVRSRWGDDLPTVAGEGLVLAQLDDAVLAVDARSGEELGRVESTTRDRWLIAQWDPRRPVLEFATDVAETPPPAGQLVYVQVSSSHNPEWARDFAENLRRAGVAATVLPPGSNDELHRVVLGPYRSRDEAESTARRLGLPFWIFTQDTTSSDTTGDGR